MEVYTLRTPTVHMFDNSTEAGLLLMPPPLIVHVNDIVLLYLA